MSNTLSVPETTDKIHNLANHITPIINIGDFSDVSKSMIQYRVSGSEIYFRSVFCTDIGNTIFEGIKYRYRKHFLFF